MSRSVTLVGWALLAGWVLLGEIGARVHARRPTLADLVRSAAAGPVTRAVLLAGWLWVGWHLFVRVDR